jgi:hypothetical protein
LAFWQTAARNRCTLRGRQTSELRYLISTALLPSLKVLPASGPSCVAPESTRLESRSAQPCSGPETACQPPCQRPRQSLATRNWQPSTPRPARRGRLRAIPGVRIRRRVVTGGAVDLQSTSSSHLRSLPGWSLRAPPYRPRTPPVSHQLQAQNGNPRRPSRALPRRSSESRFSRPAVCHADAPQHENLRRRVAAPAIRYARPSARCFASSSRSTPAIPDRRSEPSRFKRPTWASQHRTT